MEKVRNFLRNYLESEKFFSKFSYRIFLGLGKGKFFTKFSYSDLKVKVSENFRNLKVYLNLKVKIFKKKISTKLLKVKNKNISLNFRVQT